VRGLCTVFHHHQEKRNIKKLTLEINLRLRNSRSSEISVFLKVVKDCRVGGRAMCRGGSRRVKGRCAGEGEWSRLMRVCHVREVAIKALR
jgi:hypothetical protein